MSKTYTQEFEEAKNQLKDCQEKNQLSSCMQCPQVLECAIRNKYVKETYSYLSEGNDGDFSF